MIPNVWSIAGILICFFGYLSCQSIYDEHFLIPGRIYRSSSQINPKLSVYCYKGVPTHLFHIWQTVYLSISLNPEEYSLYHGANTNEVVTKFESQRSSWTSQLFTFRSKNIKLDPFNVSCVGVDTAESYEVVAHVIRIDLYRVFQFFCGVFLFLAAPRLSSNPLFYYICGITLGVTTSFLILVYILSKLIPKRPAVYGFLVGGWTIGIYLFQFLWQNVKTIVINYQSHVFAYMIVTGFISFVICYRFGPVTDPRSKNLIKWSLQVAAIIAIFFSSQHQEAAVALVIILLSYYNFPSSWTSRLLATWKKRFPPKAKFISEDEYHEQGARETVKALDELRKYCSSPDCNQWKTVLRLREPIRFAQFMEGNSHLIDDELMEYESESKKSIFSSDDSSEDEY